MAIKKKAPEKISSTATALNAVPPKKTSKQEITRKKTPQKKLPGMVINPNFIVTTVMNGFLAGNSLKIISALLDGLPERSRNLFISRRLSLMDEKAKQRMMNKHCTGKRSPRKVYLEQLGLQAEKAGMVLKRKKKS